MAKIFDALKDLISPELISSASKALGEDNLKVTSAVASIVPGLLGSILAKGNSPELESSLSKAGAAHNDILSNVSGLFSGKSDSILGQLGGSFLSSVFGDKLGGFSSLISSISGVSSEGSSKLISMVSPLIAGFLGNKMKTGGGGLLGLLGSLSSEKNSFLGAIPSGLTGLLGLSSLSGLGDKFSAGVNEVSSAASSAVHGVAKKSGGWLKWLLLALAVLALLFFWKTCSDNKQDIVVQNPIQAEVLTPAITTAERILQDLTLPDGITLQAYSGGIEDQVINFLRSDDYKKANGTDLKDKWFTFDNIGFNLGSAELTAESSSQLNNIVTILKHFKDAKVKIGGYTDKSGSSDANLKLSQERANTIKSFLAKAGVGSQIAGAEGYGDKFAKYPADAPDSERALDRKLALRFEK